jgi:DNA-binding transcriptional ArsR family regulator
LKSVDPLPPRRPPGCGRLRALAADRGGRQPARAAVPEGARRPARLDPRDATRLARAEAGDPRLSFLFENAFPDCFIPPELGTRIGFDDHLARVRALAPAAARYELAWPLFHYAEASAGGEEQLADEATRERILDWARGSAGGDEAERLAGLILDDPVEALERLVALLERYWLAVRGRVGAPRGRPRAGGRREQAAIETEGALSFLACHNALRREGDTIVRRSPHEHTVEITPERRLMLTPSAYVWPHVRVNCDAPWPLVVIYPAGFVTREAARRAAPPELLSLLRAAGDDSRLRILKLVAERPRTTEELAPLVSLSEPALSRHLRILGEAGLVSARRDGYYVLYRLEGAALARLSADLQGFLEG